MHFKCGRCRDGINDEEDERYVKLGGDDVEIFKESCYLGNTLVIHDSTDRAVIPSLCAG